MQQSDGKIFANPTDKDIAEKRLTPLTSHEEALLRNLPELMRPMALAEHRYIQERARLGRKDLTIHEKNGFRCGFAAGRESMKGGA